MSRHEPIRISLLRYIIAHELAHIAVKRHTWRFWKIVGIIYPEYEKGKEVEQVQQPRSTGQPY
jgi:predicted metal-dependent hydrolase